MEATSVTSKGQAGHDSQGTAAAAGNSSGQPHRVFACRRPRRDAGQEFAAGQGCQWVRIAAEPARRGADRLRPRDVAAAMIGLDSNVLARYYIDDDADAQAQRQRLAARSLIESGQPLMVSKSVILELEWVMRGCYGFAQAEVTSVMRHLLEQAHIAVEDRGAVDRRFPTARRGSISPMRCTTRATSPATAWRHSTIAGSPGGPENWG